MVDPSRLGYQTYHLYLQVREKAGEEANLLKQVVDYFSEQKEAAAIQKIIGRYQIYMALRAHNIQEIEAILVGAVERRDLRERFCYCF